MKASLKSFIQVSMIFLVGLNVEGFFKGANSIQMRATELPFDMTITTIKE